MIPQIANRHDGSVALSFPYHRGVVDALKSSIPADGRSYHPSTRTWTAAPPYADTARRLMREAFPFVAETEAAGAPAPDPIRQTDHAYADLHLLPSAPPALVEAAFRCLSKQLHPDRGGQHEAMIRLNAAVSALRARQGVAS